MSKPLIGRRQAIKTIQNVAAAYRIADAFELFDDGMIEHKLGQVPEMMRANPGVTAAQAWQYIVEAELGIEPGDPREIAEYRLALS
jgi:hypothetical protein